jgi:signal transduction histidine kinase
MWKLSIKDNGVGIEGEFQEIVFDMFKRLKSTSLSEGSGVGLSICKKIVEAHGGNIIVQSNPDGGCEFTLWLPK